MATSDVSVHGWVAHRPHVVRSVAARVPGIDAEEATSRALEKMVRIVSTGGTINDPAPYWRRAAVNEAISMTREAGRAHAVEDDTLDDLTPPAAGAELDAERHADVSMLRTALADLADDDRQILLDRHVHDRAVTDIATGLGVRPHAVTMRLRRAEERLAGAFAAAHAHAVGEPECRTTRAAMHDYLKGRLLPRRQRRLEVHMDGCTECTRAFIDVREVSWLLRDLGQHVIGGVLATGSVGSVAAGAGAGALGTRPRTFGKKETSVAASVVAVLAIGSAAAAYLHHQTDEPPPQAIVNLGGSGDGSLLPPIQDLPPSIPPADPEPRPATTPKENQDPVLQPVTAPDQDVAEPEPAPEPEAEPRSEPEPALEPADAGPAEPANPPANPPADPPAAKPANPPAAEPEPAPRPDPEPETEPSPPQPETMSGPPGNPGNEHGKGPTKNNDQGPGNGNDKGPGNGNGKGQAPDGDDADLTEQLASLLALPSIAGTPGVVLLDGLRRRRH